MITRALLAASPILLFPCPLLAQSEVGPGLSGALTLNARFTPPGALYVSDVTYQTLPGDDFVGITWQQSWTGPRLLNAYNYDPATNTVTGRNDFISLNLNAQEISISRDLKTLLTYDSGGAGAVAFYRPTVTAAWVGPRTIANLPARAYGLEFCSIGGGTNVLACFNDPAHASIEIYDFDPITLSVSNPVSLQPNLGHPSNFVTFAIPLDDCTGETRGVVACIRQPVGFQQQWQFTGGVDPTAGWSLWFNSPTNSFFIGGDQLEGGHLVCANAGLPISAVPNGSIDVFGTFTFDTIASTRPGTYDLTMMGPPGDLGVMAIALSRGPFVTVPGFQNGLGLDAGTIVANLSQPMPMGVGHWRVSQPLMEPVEVPVQGVSVKPIPSVYNAFGSTNWYSIRR